MNFKGIINNRHWQYLGATLFCQDKEFKWQRVLHERGLTEQECELIAKFHTEIGQEDYDTLSGALGACLSVVLEKGEYDTLFGRKSHSEASRGFNGAPYSEDWQGGKIRACDGTYEEAGEDLPGTGDEGGEL